MTTVDEWKPKLVKECTNPNIPKNRAVLDWDSKEVQEWKLNAIKMQEAHARDNSRTLWYAYLPEERDAIELRILIVLYGIRIPFDKNMPPPSCPLKVYSHEERLHARKVKKAIVKQAGKNAEKIYFNVIYISVACLDDDNNLIATEEPVFIVKGSNKPVVDRDAKGYESFNSYREKNNLPKGGAIFPENGSYTSKENSTDNRIPLVAIETPNASFGSRLKAVTDAVAMVGGLALTVTGLILCAPAGVFSAAATSAATTGSFYGGTALSAYSVASAGASIFTKMNNNSENDESIKTELFTIATAALSAYTQRLSGAMAFGARNEKTLTETINGLTKIEQKLFPLLNHIKLITFFTGFSGLCTSLYEMCIKKERTWFDYFQFSMLLFMTANTLAKPWTLKEIFETERMNCFNEIRKGLDTKESQTELDKMLKAHNTTDEKTYMIRSLNQIDNKNEFFELINKTGSVVKCSADGLVINDKIDIHPKAYNAIGRNVILTRMGQIEKYGDSALQKSTENNLINLISEERVNDFKEGLEEALNRPTEQRREATRALFEKCEGNVDDFDNQWQTITDSQKDDMNAQIEKMVDNMRTGVTDENQLNDFKTLKNLTEMRVNGTITDEDRKMLNEIINKCSSHRKEQFFKTSKATTTFAEEIRTFNNGQSERLCYRIDVENVKSNLQQIFERSDYENVQIKGKKIFNKMTLGEYDRINRILKEQPNNDVKKALMIAATTIANDTNFGGNVQTVDDMASVMEAIMQQKNELGMKSLNFYTSLSDGQSENYENFRTTFNERINAVMRLNENIRSQWSSPLSMTYHHWKHEKDFGTTAPVTLQQYFEIHANSIFSPSNAISNNFTQTGGIQQIYSKSFGKRFHVGYTVGTDECRRSHFVKDNTI